MLIETTDSYATLEHYVAYPETVTNDTHVVFLFHAWNGRDQKICEKAEQFSELGYIAVAVDLYGKGVLGHSVAENQRLMDPFIENRDFLRQRMKSIFDELAIKYSISPSNSVAIGYCFGGMCVLDSVRNNFGFLGAVSVHGKYDKPNYETCDNYVTKTLILHGMKDPIVTMDKLMCFTKEFSLQSDDFQVILFSNGLHGFTDINATNPIRGTLYSKMLDVRSSGYIENFMAECFSVQLLKKKECLNVI